MRHARQAEPGIRVIRGILMNTPGFAAPVWQWSREAHERSPAEAASAGIRSCFPRSGGTLLRSCGSTWTIRA